MFMKVIVVTVLAVVCFADELPSFIKKCRFEDVKCISRTATEMLKNYPTEMSTHLGFSQFDPFRLDRVTIEESLETPNDLKLVLTNCMLAGLSKTIFDRAVGWNKDASNSKFELYGNMPTLNFSGNYNIEGHLVSLPIQGAGEYNMVLDDITFEIKFKPIVEVRDGKQYFKINKLKMRIDPAKFYCNLSNLFNGNEELGNALNEVINKNWRDAWDELAPALYDVSETTALNILQGFFDKFAYDDIFLPDM